MAELIVGLTGGLACGKSTVARRLAAAGFTVIDADHLVHTLYLPGEPGAVVLAELFGRQILDPSGTVDRDAVAAKIFHDEKARRQVERAIHPLVLERFRHIASKIDGIVIYESAILIESGHADLCDLVVTVEAPIEIQLARAMKRGMDEADARARLTAQGDDVGRRQQADIIIDNAGGLDALATRVAELAETLRGMVAAN